MSKKPIFSTTKEKRLAEAKQELEKEIKDKDTSEKTVQTTVVLEATLLYAVKEIALKRKQEGVKPDNVTGIIKHALKELVTKESGKHK